MHNFAVDLKNIFDYVENAQGEMETLLEKLSSPYIQIKHYRKGEIVIEGLQPLSHIYILLTGDVYISNYSIQGKRIISNTLEAPQFLGLIEGINGEKQYMATVVTLTKSTFIKVERELFLHTMGCHFDLANYIVKYLARLTIFIMENSSIKMSLSDFDKLLLYLYNEAIGQKVPVYISENKSFIADLLNINIRTLYRYLDMLTKENMIQRVGQAIVLEKENIEKIAKRVESFI